MNLTAADQSPDLETVYFNPSAFRLNSINWVNFLVISLMHAGAFAAFFFFTWEGLAWMVGLYCFTGCIGITLCYHRMLTHRGLRLHPVPQSIAHLAGALSMQGLPLDWAMGHRIHHARSDKPGDPHSPHDGPWWSHMFWLFPARDYGVRKKLMAKYIPDLLRDPISVFFQNTYLVWNVLLGAGLLWFGGLPWFLWGFCLRTVLVWHMTWLINSATHIWGYRNYTTTDLSKNLWWVAFFTFGEGWHNNHHAHPVSAYHGHKWWEFDATGWVISIFSFFGLATHVRGTKPTNLAS
jgi:stearoyl-CoA desaturase (delta-9 desaturase)